MRYITLNLLAFCMLAYSINLSANNEPENDPEIEENYVPDWDKTIEEIEREAGIHDTWDTWGQRD